MSCVLCTPPTTLHSLNLNVSHAPEPVGILVEGLEGDLAVRDGQNGGVTQPEEACNQNVAYTSLSGFHTPKAVTYHDG